MQPTSRVNPIEPHYNVALNHAWMWIKATWVPAGRLLFGDTSGLPDALSLLLNLRQVYRCAEMSRDAVTRPEAKKIIEDAIADFDKAFPDVKNARDIVEHFDEYAVGVGQLHTNPKKMAPAVVGLNADQLAHAFATSYNGAGKQSKLTVGSRTIDITKVPDAMVKLFEAMRAAAEAEDGR